MVEVGRGPAVRGRAGGSDRRRRWALVGELLQRRFGARRRELLGRTRAAPGTVLGRRRAGLPARDRGRPRRPVWRVAPAPPTLTDRRVEITGPDRRRRWRSTRSTPAPRSGSPTSRTRTPRTGTTWSAARSSLRHAVRGTLEFTLAGRAGVRAERGRPRGHRRAAPRLAPRRAARPGRRPCRSTGALVDFGLHFVAQRRRSCSPAAAGPYYYLPKMESHLEARLWNDVFTHAAGAASASRTARSAPPC